MLHQAAESTLTATLFPETTLARGLRVCIRAGVTAALQVTTGRCRARGVQHRAGAGSGGLRVLRSRSAWRATVLLPGFARRRLPPSRQDNIWVLLRPVRSTRPA